MLDQVTQLVWVFVGIYLSILLGIVLYYSRPSLHTTDYFLAGRRVNWFGVGCSLFASNFLFEGILLFSAASILGFLNAKHFIWALCLYVLFTSWILVPGFRKAGLSSLPELLERRFHPHLRLYMSGLLLFSFGYLKISLVLLAASSILQALLGWQMTVSAIFLFSIAGLYVLMSGQRTLIRVDILQAMAIIMGMLAFIFDRDMVTYLFSNAAISIAGRIVPYAHSFARQGSFGLITLVGLVIMALWFGLGDQYLTQRIACAKNTSQAKGGSLFAGYLRALAILLAFPIIFKTSAFFLPQTVTAMRFSQPTYSATAFGITIVAVLAATLSTLASSLNSSAYLFVNDFFPKIKPNASNDELLLVGRLGTTALILLSLILIPMATSLKWPSYLALVAFPAYFWPPLLAVILLGAFWRAVTARGAAVVILIGLFLAGMRIFMWKWEEAASTGAGILRRLAEMDFVSFAFFSFSLSFLLLVLFSKQSQATHGVFSNQSFDRSIQKMLVGANDSAVRWHIGISIAFVFLLTVLWTTAFF